LSNVYGFVVVQPWTADEEMGVHYPCLMRTLAVLAAVLIALFPPRSSLELQVSSFSATVQDLATGALGVERMQDHYDSLVYSVQHRDAAEIADELAQQLEDDFGAQGEALSALKRRIELLYSIGDTTLTKPSTQCCNLNRLNLSQHSNFPVNVSIMTSCDRVSAEAGPGMHQDSLFGKLTDVYMDNYQPPLKWQYFGSETGVCNVYPAFRADSCGSFDPRFRPWYTASATPNFKDVVVVVKNNRFINPDDYNTLIQAANILINTLNPRDRLAVLMYNSGVHRPALSGCYASSLSTASPANIVKFQNFLFTAPDPLDGNNLFGALKSAFDYLNCNREFANYTRDRAIAVFTDGEKMDSKDAMDNITALVNSSNNVSLFFFVSVAAKSSPNSAVRSFYKSLLLNTATSQNHYIELTSGGNLRDRMQPFYSTFSTQLGSTFKPIFIPPYYKSGLDQLVSSLCTPCFKRSNGQLTLVGVAGVDLSLSEVLQGMDYFQGDSMAYAFIIDQEGLVLYHPLLSTPTITSSSVYLHITTLEHATNFSEVVDSMTRGEVGCKLLASSTTAYKRVESAPPLTNQYCWQPIGDTPFFLCVVNPVNIDFKTINGKSFALPIEAQYHRLDLLGSENNTMCSRFNSKVVQAYSTVHLSPWAFAKPNEYLLGQETAQTAKYIQTAMQKMSDPKQMLQRKVLEAVAATAKVNSLWVSNQSSPYEDYISWRYIATPTGVMRIYPGVQLASKDATTIKSAWYRRAVANIGVLALSTPHPDVLGTRNVITFSQAIVSKSCNEGPQDYNCSVLAVMGMDITYPSLTRLLRNTTPLCQDGSYRCMIIDGNGYLIAHESFDGTGNEQYVHISEREPLLSQDMLLSGYLEKSYCYSFQYDDNFTKRPRRKYSYAVTSRVQNSPYHLQGGYSTYCIFYSIAPISLTNGYLIVVDQKKTDLSLCSRSISCTCNVDWPCSSIPQDCTCPCYDDIPADNYNPCLETFQHLVASVCPVPFLNETIPVLSSLSNTLPSCSDLSCDQYGSDFSNCTCYADCQLCAVSSSSRTAEKKCLSACPVPVTTITTTTLTTSLSTLSSPPPSHLTTTMATVPRNTMVLQGAVDHSVHFNHSVAPPPLFIGTLRTWQDITIVCTTIAVMVLVSMVIGGILYWRRNSFLKAAISKNSTPQNGPEPECSATRQRVMGVVNGVMMSSHVPNGSRSGLSTNEESDVGIAASPSSCGERDDSISVENHCIEHGVVERDVIEQGSIDPSNAGGVWF
ncbi:hypothetical protein EMCRGX_G006337, partial [Ephydatia muelleri]